MSRSRVASLERALRSLRSRAGARLRLCTWSWSFALPGDGPESRAVQELDSPDGLPPTGCDAILLEMDFDSLDTSWARSLHGALDERGKLVVLDRGTPDDGSRQRVVRVLSEAGFLLDDAPAPCEEGYLLVARRDEFTLRPYREGDDPAIAALFESSFHVARRDAHWRWKYHQSPFGNDYITLAVARGGELATHYAGYPVPFWRSGEALVALHMGDTMTHPRFRRVGRGATSLLARTVRYFFALHRPGPFAFFYGFNTGGIQRFCKWFIGGYEVSDVHHVERVGARSDALRPGPDYDVRAMSFPGAEAELDALFERVAPHYGFLTRRDARYLKWRYHDCPDGSYAWLGGYRGGELVGWSVFGERDETLVWGDALFDPEHRNAAANVLMAALDRLPARRIHGWFPPRPRFWDETLDALGFVRAPEPQGLKLMVLAEAFGPEQLSALYYTKGDSDLF